MSEAARRVFSGLPAPRLMEYHRYWKGIAPASNADRFRRWLFAFCSVHTTWESNVRGYEAIKDLGWLGDDENLCARLRKSGAGLHHNRTRYISAFAGDYWSRPEWYLPLPGEAWRVARDRMEREILGLGPAKTSFALEMIDPASAQLACLDVHMLRLYTTKPLKTRPADYHRWELDWVRRSQDIGHAPYIARMVWWDAQQGQNSSRYWSKTLEA